MPRRRPEIIEEQGCATTDMIISGLAGIGASFFGRVGTAIPQAILSQSIPPVGTFGISVLRGLLGNLSLTAISLLLKRASGDQSDLSIGALALTTLSSAALVAALSGSDDALIELASSGIGLVVLVGWLLQGTEEEQALRHAQAQEQEQAPEQEQNTATPTA